MLLGSSVCRGPGPSAQSPAARILRRSPRYPLTDSEAQRVISHRSLTVTPFAVLVRERAQECFDE